MKIVLASSNPHKIKEMNEIVHGLDINFVLPSSDFNPIENGKTFEENSLIKAKEAWNTSKTWTLADDSGLCIDALDGEPGIYSARYEETPQKRRTKVLDKMQATTNRNARFKCSMTLLNPQGEIAISYTGICEGNIANEERGTNGFGYDPIFLLKNSNQTMAELSEEEKNKVSHRAKALEVIINYLKENVLL